MRALILGEDELRTLAALRDHGEAHPIRVEEAMQIFRGQASPAGDRDGFWAMIPMGFRVVYSVEETPRLAGGDPAWLRRLSVSVEAAGRWPHHAAIGELARVMGLPPLNMARISTEYECEAIEASWIGDPPEGITTSAQAADSAPS